MIIKKVSVQKYWILGMLLFLVLQGPLPLYSQDTPDPTPRDTCPVCGMFVAPYPNWITTVLYKDGTIHHFDGAKDLFTYLLDMKKWAQGHDKEDIELITVKEYYGLKKIDARTALYVVGSDIMGPMGHELIPFAAPAEAETFLRDHQGKKIYRFDEIDMSIVAPLKMGHKMKMKMK